MAHNLTNLIQSKVVPGLYKQYYQQSTTAWMEANAARMGAVWKGGKYVYFTEMEVEGMANYDRQLGYVNGDVAGSKIQYTMTQDRGRRFPIDYLDNDETGFLLSVANVMAEYNRKWVIPELDCYRYSTIHNIVKTNQPTFVNDDAILTNKIVEMLSDDLTTMRDRVGVHIPMIIVMSGLTQRYFGREWIHNLDYVGMNNGVVQTKVRAVDGCPFVIVPSAYLKTKYNFLDGTTPGQEAGGFAAADDAIDMKWMILPMDGPIAIVKHDKVRVFDPDNNQQANGWAVDHRIFHDLWMMPNGYNNSFIRTGTITAPDDVE